MYPNNMEEHAGDLLHLALWLVVGLGSIGLALLAFFGKQLIEEVHEIRDLLVSETSQLREMQHAQNVRVTALEEWRRLVEYHVIGPFSKNNSDERPMR
jgi:hypothetical protein